jgi:hypothetical protein
MLNCHGSTDYSVFFPCFHYVGEKMSASRVKDERGIISKPL